MTDAVELLKSALDDLNLVESFRNEMVKSTEASQNLLINTVFNNPPVAQAVRYIEEES